jgi:hypothetical protein
MNDNVIFKPDLDLEWTLDQLGLEVIFTPEALDLAEPDEEET